MSVKFKAKHLRSSNCSSGYVIVGIYDNDDFTSSAGAVNSKANGLIELLLANEDLAKSVGSTILLPVVSGIDAKRLFIVRLGPRDKFDATQFNKSIGGVAARLSSLSADSVSFFIDDMKVQDRDLAWTARRTVELISQHLYKFDQLKKKKNGESTAKWKIELASESEDHIDSIRDGIRIGKAISKGVKFSRDLGNLPGNICTPTYLADVAKGLSGYDGITVEVLEEEDMEELRMGALLSVSRGSREPAKLIIVKYDGGPADEAPTVLVGKGLTFDAGGISIKPSAAMDEMKFDMCGAAGVLGALLAAAALKLPINVVGAIASSENLPDGAANKPGDIVRSMAGTTIEILNTDAEGRLILCDALTYIGKYNPAVVIDAATLTGACVIALGHFPTGLFSNDESLAEELIAAGNMSDDRVWPLPIWEDYQSMLDSNFADVANIGGKYGGAITAACFLARFTKDYRWAHLDIAGTAWKSGKEKGSTGRPVSLFVQYLLDRCNSST